MQVRYNLPDLSLAISCYIHEASQGYTACGWDVQGNVSMWNKFHLQLHSSFRSRYLDKSQVVQAFPPSPSHPLGNCDAVLLCRPGNRVVYSMIVIELQLFLLFIHILDVAQVHVVFMPRLTNNLPSYFSAAPLCYVRFFRILSFSRPCVGLYQVERVDPLNSLHAGIVPLTEVVRLLDLIPIFDTAFSNIPPSSNTCMEGYACYYLNTFADKDTFHALSLQSQ